MAEWNLPHNLRKQMGWSDDPDVQQGALADMTVDGWGAHSTVKKDLTYRAHWLKTLRYKVDQVMDGSSPPGLLLRHLEWLDDKMRRLIDDYEIWLKSDEGRSDHGAIELQRCYIEANSGIASMLEGIGFMNESMTDPRSGYVMSGFQVVEEAMARAQEFERESELDAVIKEDALIDEGKSPLKQANQAKKSGGDAPPIKAI